MHVDKLSRLCIIHNLGYGKETNGPVIKEILAGVNRGEIKERSLVDIGLLELLRETLHSETDTRILFDACWLITNIVSVCQGTKAGEYFLEDLGTLVHCQDIGVAGQAMGAIGNIVGDGLGQAQMAIDLECHLAIIDRLMSFSISSSYDPNDNVANELVENGIWALSNLTHYGKRLNYTEDRCRDILSVMSGYLTPERSWNKDVFLAALNLKRAFPTLTGYIFTTFSGFVVETLSSTKNADEFFSAVELCGDFVGSEDYTFTDYFIHRGLLGILKRRLGKDGLADHRICWVLSNVGAGTSTQAQQIINFEILDDILKIANEPYINGVTKVEITYVLSNIFTRDDLVFLFSEDFKKKLIRTVYRVLFHHNNPRSKANCVETLRIMLELYPETCVSALQPKEYQDMVKELNKDQ
jgi:hypothetical protein